MRNVEVVYDEVILVLRGLFARGAAGGDRGAARCQRRGQIDDTESDLGLLKSEEGEVSRGDIVFGGERINGIDPDKIVRRGIFQVMEGRRIIGDMTALENLQARRLHPPRQGHRRRYRAGLRLFPRLKERTGLAGYLSGGEQQMLAIGRALMARPKLILMDEPSMGLSPLLVKEVFGIIRRSTATSASPSCWSSRTPGRRSASPATATSWSRARSCSTARAEALRDNEDVKEFYLGGAGEERKSFKNLKSFKRRKRWL